MYSKLHEQTMNLNNVRKVRIGVQIRYNHVDDNFNSSNLPVIGSGALQPRGAKNNLPSPHVTVS